MSEILTTALRFASLGICAVPVATDGSKRPGIASWKEFQERRPTPDELLSWFSSAEGVGVICGKVSGNLEMLELEGRAVAAKMHKDIKEIAENSGLADLWNKLNSGYVETTPSGGIHWLYRIDGEVPGNTKLARRPGENGGVDVLAETRGEGGFVIVAPTAGTCHPSGGEWRMLVGSPDTIPTLTREERDSLHNLFSIFDELPTADFIAEEIATKTDGPLTPGDDYNARVSWHQILEPLGWTPVYTNREGVTAWRRPGKSIGISATTNHAGTDKFYCFSTSTIFDGGSSYSKFAAYALIEHGGDFREAARSLRLLGYGGSQELTTLAPGDYAPSGVQMHDEEGNVIVDSSWIPKIIESLDLEADTEPTMLRREDGNHILYPGKINAIFGESESGKTWVALEAVRQELAKGNRVFYIDFEDSARGIMNRLKVMNTPTTGFHAFFYANPDTPYTSTISEALMASLAECEPSLIVVDGVNAAMNLMGLDLEKNKDATEFSQRILRPLRSFGAGILTIDHVTKSKDTRGNYAIGAQAKRADIDGVAISVTVEQPFGRGTDGALALTVTKDRPGFVRAICPDAKTLGIANIKSAGESLTISISGGTVQIASRDQKMEMVADLLARHGYEMGRREILDLLRKEGRGIGNEEIIDVIDALIANGSVSYRKEGRKFLYGFRAPYLAADVKAFEPVDNWGQE
jgi:KaiC/GvpD/RAD55 family RecA-like ATPase